LSFRVPEALAHYIVPKGSAALDGVSLTVNEVSGCVFGVNIIPHTWRNTTLGRLKSGDHVNFEVDLLARYAGGLLKAGGYPA
jgi:riboflavin synthase